jgi:outer membrane lipoprotein SlyB
LAARGPNRLRVGELSPSKKRRAIGAILGTEVGAATGLLAFGGTPLVPLIVTAIGALAGALAVSPVLRLRDFVFRRWLRKSLRARA